MKARSRRGAVAIVVVLALAGSLGALAIGQAQAGSVPVVIGGGRPDTPAISGTDVVWADKVSGNWDLYHYSGIGGQTTKLTSGLADEAMPSLSGSRLAYVDFSTNLGDVVVRDLITGVSTKLEIDGAQMYPSVSGDWIAYQNEASRSSRVVVSSLTGALGPYSAGADGAPALRPVIGGDLCVYEDHGAQPSGRFDGDVGVIDLLTGAKRLIASSPAQEVFATTDGRYIAWSEETASGGWRIRMYDYQTDAYTNVSSGDGEETRPAIGGGFVYWVHNKAGEALHVDRYEIATGQTRPYYTYSTGSVLALSASGKNAAWLENAAKRRVRAVFAEGLGPAARLAALVPFSSLMDSVQLATLSAGGDLVPPQVVSTSVQPGEKNVSKTDAVSVFFSEPLSPGSVNAETVKLVSASGAPVKSSVRYSALGNSVSLQPETALAADTYRLIVDPTVTDKAGNALGNPTEVSFSTSEVLAAAAPSAVPRINYVRPVGKTQVEINWNPATDDVMVTRYYVLRSLQPMKAGSYPGVETAAVVTGAPAGTSVTTLTASLEASTSYTYWYVVRAGDADGNVGDPSPMASPNPHGMWLTTGGYNTSSCLRCHSVHGGPALPPKLGANSAAACYQCHGGTPGNDGYGYASTFDTQGDFNDDSVISTNSVGNGGWSIHRTGYMYQGDGASVNYECVSCHSPHRKAYDSSTTLSFGRLLRKYPSFTPTSSVYSTDSAPFAEDFCYSCHGPSSTAIDRLAGAGTWDSSRGDHQTSYTVSAHGPATVTVAASGRQNGANLPKIACLACHDKHASSASDLVDWRGSGDKTGKWSQAMVCLECHTDNAGLDARAETLSVSTSTRRAWNDRDVADEFARGASAGGSAHPTAVVSVVPSFDATWTEPPFDTTSYSNTVVNGSVVELAPSGSGYVGSGFALSPVITTTGIRTLWKTLTFIRTQPGATTLTVDVCDSSGLVLYSNVSSPFPIPEPFTTDLRLKANLTAPLPVPLNTGDDFDDNSFNTSFWTDNVIGSTDPDATNATYEEFFEGWEENNLQSWPATGSTGTWSVSNAAWPNTTNANKTGTYSLNGGNGTATGTYYRANWMRNLTGFSGNLNWSFKGSLSTNHSNASWIELQYTTDGSTWTAIGTSRYTSTGTTAQSFTRSGTLAAPGGTWGWIAFRFAYNAAGTATTRNIYLDDLLFTGNKATNVSIWPEEASATLTARADGSGTGGTSDQFDFITMPVQASLGDFTATVKVTSIRSPYTTGEAVLMVRPSQATANAPYFASTVGVNGTTGNFMPARQYRTAAGGGVTTTNGTAGNFPIWLRVSRTGSNWSAYYSTNGSTFTQMGTAVANAGIANNLYIGLGATSGTAGVRRWTEVDFDDFTIVEAAKPATQTPTLTGWNVSYKYSNPIGRSLTCASCHNVHSVKRGGASAWDVARASNPTDTAKVPTNFTDFCLGCHTAPASVPVRTSGLTPLIKYSIGFSSITSPFFPGWDKASGTAGFRASAHFLATSANGKAECNACHDPHASAFARLTAWTRPSGATITGGVSGSRVNTVAATSQEQNLCYQCHGDGTATRGKAAGAPNVYTAITSTYGHRVANYTGQHTDTETQASLSAAEHVECVDCHNPHSAKDTTHTPGAVNGNLVSGALLGVGGVEPAYSGNWVSPTYTAISSATKEYQICFKCHSGYNTSQVASGQTTLITWGGSGSAAWTDVGLEFSPSNNSYHPVVAAVPNTAARRLETTDMANGWAPGDTLYCSDCHASSSAGSMGPHGSAVKWMLKGPNQAWPYTTAAANGTNAATGFRTVSARDTNSGSTNGSFCNNCHVVTHAYPHTYSSHNVACVYCHIRVPHGGKVSRLQAPVGGVRTSYPGNLPLRYTATGDGRPSAANAWLTGFTLPGTHDNYAYANCGTNNCTGDHPVAYGAETW